MKLNPSDNNEQRSERELDALFAAYRQACPDLEPSPQFMPRIWAEIEARRSVTYSFRRWTQTLVTAAVAICLLLGLLQTYLPSQPTFYTLTYLEALEAANALEIPPQLEFVVADNGGGGSQ